MPIRSLHIPVALPQGKKDTDTHWFTQRLYINPQVAYFPSIRTVNG